MPEKHARLTAEAVTQATDRTEVEVYIPEWNGWLAYRALSYDQLTLAREKAWDARKRETNEDLLNAWCMALGLVEPAIDFEVAKAWICERSFGAVNSVLSAILTASGLGKRAQAEAKSTTPG